MSILEMDRRLFWLVVAHLTFVASGVLMALMDYLTSRADTHDRFADGPNAAGKPAVAALKPRQRKAY